MVLVAAAVLPAGRADAESAELQVSSPAMDLSAKFYLDTEHSVFGLLGAMGTGGKTMLDAGLYLSGMNLIFRSAPLLPQAYGIDMEHLKENLPSSVFAPDSGSKYALEQQVYDSILEAAGEGIAALTPGGAAAPEMAEEQMALLGTVGARYAQKLLGLVTENAQMSMAPEAVTVGDLRIDTSKITLTLDSEALSAIVQEFLSEAAQDSEFEALMEILYSMANRSGTVPAGVKSASELWASLPELSDKAVNKIAKEQYSLTLGINNAKKSNILVRASMQLSTREDTLEICFTHGGVFNPPAETSLEILANGKTAMLLTYSDLDGGFGICLSLNDGSAYALAAQIAEDNEEVFAGTVTLTQTGKTENTILFTALWDKIESRFALGLDSNGKQESIAGSVEEDGDAVTISLTEVNGNPVSGIRLILRSTDTMEVPAFREVTAMSEDEVTTLVTSVQVVMNMLKGMA